jgi:hypothetical protein
VPERRKGFPSLGLKAAAPAFGKTKSNQVILDEEGESYLWISIEKALDLNLGEGTKRYLNIYLNKQK